MFLETSEAVAVFFAVAFSGFVGVVEEAFSGESLGAEEVGELREELVEEVLVLG